MVESGVQVDMSHCVIGGFIFIFLVCDSTNQYSKLCSLVCH